MSYWNWNIKDAGQSHKKEISEINQIEIMSIKDIKSQVDLKSYDMIISTVRLPFINVEYTLVNPLLTEANIATIKSFLQNHIASLTTGKQYAEVDHFPKVYEENLGLNDMLQDLKDVQQSVEAIANHFRFYRRERWESQEEILEAMLQKAEEESLLENRTDVLKSLRERETLGGLGIPQTNIALFHARNKHVHQLIFQITHLPNPCLVKGMDGNDVLMKNLILMLAPAELSLREQEILSLISTSIIETDESLLIFSSANEDLIYNKLKSILVKYIETNFKIMK